MLIEHSLYREIVTKIPILCVDIVLWYRDRMVLIKRVSEPMKDVYWVIGGRVHIGESVANAAIRKVKEETNLCVTIDNLKMIGVYEDIYQNNVFGKTDCYHTLAVVFEGKVDDISDILLNDTSSDFILSDKLPDRFQVKYF